MRQASFQTFGVGPEQEASLIGEFRERRVPGSCEGRAIRLRRKTVNKDDISGENGDLVQDIPGWEHGLCAL